MASFYTLDKELLIKLIHERPAIWDKYANDYKLKNVKKEAWREICRAFKEDYDSLEEEEQEEYCRFLIKTWTRIRDAWLKTLNDKALRKPQCRPYKYHKHMLFLKKVVHKRDYHELTQNDKITERNTNTIELNDSDSDDSDIDQTNDGDLSENSETPSNRNKAHEISNIIIQNVCSDVSESQDIPSKRKKIHQISNVMIPDSVVIEGETQQVDRHLAFFKSIQPTVTKFDEDQFLEFQAGVISLIRRIKSEKQYVDWDQPHTSTNAPKKSHDFENMPIKRSPNYLHD